MEQDALSALLKQYVWSKNSLARRRSLEEGVCAALNPRIKRIYGHLADRAVLMALRTMQEFIPGYSSKNLSAITQLCRSDERVFSEKSDRTLVLAIIGGRYPFESLSLPPDTQEGVV